MTMKIQRLLIYFTQIGLILNISSCNSQISKSKCDSKDSLHWVTTTNGCLHIYTYKSKIISDTPNLVIIIHGDAPFNKPGYQYKMARLISEQNQNTIAIGLLRPGYTDDDGNTSDGQRGLTTGDNYTPDVITAIAQGIEKLKNRYHPKKTILVGHSGGAAITGDIIGMEPKLINKAVLVSCPCDLPKWRKYMSEKQFYNLAWHDSVLSVSPNSVIKEINKETEIVIVCGEKDDITPIELSISYFQKTQESNLKSKLIQIPNKSHEIFLDEHLFNAINQILNE